MTVLERTIIDRVKASVAKRLSLCRVILFGSRARGDAEADSDLDVLVILNEPVTREAEDYVSDCAWEAGFEHGIVVVPVTVSRHDWEEGLLSSSLLAIAIGKEGVPV